MNDPYLYISNCIQRLLDDYDKHPILVVAVDYDNTIFDLHNKGYEFSQVISLIKRCNNINFKIVIFTASPKERWTNIKEYCDEIGIKIDGINTDVVEWKINGLDYSVLDYSKSKIFYNILLDDRAGLGTAYYTLLDVVQTVENKGLTYVK